MSGTGDLRAVLENLLSDTPTIIPMTQAERFLRFLAALAADEPLTATVEVPCDWCSGSGQAGGPKPDGLIGWSPCSKCIATGTGTVRIVVMTEDVLRARLREFSEQWTPNPERLVDAIVRALFGQADHEPDNPQGVWCCERHRDAYHAGTLFGEASS